MLVLCVALWLLSVAKCSQKYLKGETAVSIEIKRYVKRTNKLKKLTFAISSRTGEAPFPDVTVCPAYKAAYKSDFLQGFGLTVDDVRREGLVPANVDSREFFRNATFRLEELVLHYHVSTKYYKDQGSRGNVFSPQGGKRPVPFCA